MNNSGLAIRHKLYDFIRVADDKKLAAIYHLLESEMENTMQWWKNKELTTELDRRYSDLESGVDKGFLIKEVETSINKLRKKKHG